MANIVVAPPPDISEGDLIFNQEETRSIFKFFWPHLAADIEQSDVTTEVRRFAQAILIAAIDASYAMGFLDKLTTTLANPRGGIKAMGKKLAQRFLRHWWKHATQDDLMDVKIYESVRVTVARNFKTPGEMLLRGASLPSHLAPVYVAVEAGGVAWG